MHKSNYFTANGEYVAPDAEICTGGSLGMPLCQSNPLEYGEEQEAGAELDIEIGGSF